jgi:regulatory protein YycI of two-component signal transduction system YycFG
MRIRESLEMKYEQFKGLKGLKVKEMKKQQMLQNIQKRQEIFIYNQSIQENLSKLDSNKNDLVIKSLKARDHIFVNIDAQDLWIKVFL